MQAKRDIMAMLLLVIVICGLITQSSTESDTKKHDKRQLENEWASTSKRNHKVSENIIIL